MRIKHSEEGYDFYVNTDNKYLRSEMENKKHDPDLIKVWFKWGLTITALGIILSESEKLPASEESRVPDLSTISELCDGVARTIIPLIRNLNELELSKLK